MTGASSPNRPGCVISAIGFFAAVAIGGLAFSLTPRGTAFAQASTGSVPVSVHIGNASGMGQSCKASSVSDIFLTIVDIQAHQSGKGSAGWHDLTPGIANGAVQVDLTGESFSEHAECFLTDVDGGTSGLPAGKYQQFKLSLLPNGTNSGGPAVNACATLGAGIFNCVESDGTLQPLTVPRGSIEIPSSQIARRGLTISPGQGGIDLDIDINVCASLLVRRKAHGATTFAFKPVLHSGEIELKPLIAGDVVLGAEANGTVSAVAPTTGIAGATVAVEQRSTNNFVEGNPAAGAGAIPSVNVEDVMAVTQTDSAGHFVFCPIALGTYDLVAGSEIMPSMASASNATITTGVIVTPNGGPNGLIIPLLPGSSPAVTIEAQLTSQGTASPSATPAVINFRVAQTVTTGVEAQIVEYNNTTTSPTFTTSDSTGTVGPACSGNQCPTGTDCACVSLGVPGDNPVIGVAGGPYAAPAASPALYSILGTAGACSPGNVITEPESAPLPTPTLSFVNCQ